jgi:hypothetical protein
MRRIGISSGSLVSNTAVLLAGMELSQLGAHADLDPPARLAIPPTGCPGRRNRTSADAGCRRAAVTAAANW